MISYAKATAFYAFINNSKEIRGSFSTLNALDTQANVAKDILSAAASIPSRSSCVCVRINTINMYCVYGCCALQETLYIIIIRCDSVVCWSTVDAFASTRASYEFHFLYFIIIMIITIIVCISAKNCMCCFKFLALIYSVAYRSDDDNPITSNNTTWSMC